MQLATLNDPFPSTTGDPSHRSRQWKLHIESYSTLNEISGCRHIISPSTTSVRNKTGLERLVIGARRTITCKSHMSSCHIFRFSVCTMPPRGKSQVTRSTRTVGGGLSSEQALDLTMNPDPSSPLPIQVTIGDALIEDGSALHVVEDAVILDQP